MWIFVMIATVFEAVGSIFGTIADRADDVPLLGDRLSGPFRDVQGWFTGLGDSFRQVQAWADALPMTIWATITSADTWLLDPAGSLWSSIWARIKTADTWLLDPAGSLWSEVWSRIKTADTWLLDPAAQVREWARDAWPDDINLWDKVKEAAWDNFLAKFDDWFVWWVEWNAEKVIDAAGKVLDRVFIDDADRERWRKWR